jgi:mRNA-degrading endonuclease RelE of RelBE toxin-antitoxin system
MAYQIVIKRTAEKELDALPSGVRDRIEVRLLRLEENPRP